MALLEVDSVSAGYGEVIVLHDVTFAVEEGDIVSIVGSNGAGKTTLLRTISGLLPTRTGEIRLDGQVISRLPPHRIVEAGVVEVPEGRQLFPYMSVIENLEVGSASPRAKSQRRERLQMVFDLFPVLAERRHQQARTLSGGEQQMLATARALMACPRVLMLDEPSLGLAPIVVRRLFESIREINRQGTAILLVEQNVQQALEMARRGYVLENGRIVLEGPGRQLLENPLLKEAYLGL